MWGQNANNPDAFTELWLGEKSTHIVCKYATSEWRKRIADNTVEHELHTDTLVWPEKVSEHVRHLHLRKTSFTKQHKAAVLVNKLDGVDCAPVGVLCKAREYPLEACLFLGAAMQG